MKTLIKSALLLLLAMTLTGCGSDASSISSDDLVYRNGIAYKKFTDVPFSGKVTHKDSGLKKGLMKNGKREGEWFIYDIYGQLRSKGNYKNDKKEGAYISYYSSGKLRSTGNYKNDKKECAWVGYHEERQVGYTTYYRNGKSDFYYRCD